MAAYQLECVCERLTALFSDREWDQVRNTVPGGGLRRLNLSGSGSSLRLSEGKAALGKRLRRAGVLPGVGRWRHFELLAFPLARYADHAGAGRSRNPYGPAVPLRESGCPKTLP